MDVRLTEEQLLLLETATRIGAAIGTNTPQALEGFDDARSWQTLADAGLLASLVPESSGGMGAGVVEGALVTEALARFTAAVPFLGSGVLATSLLALSGAQGDVFDGLASGSLRLSVGLDPTLTRLATASDPTIVAFDAARADGVLLLDEDRRVIAVSADGAKTLDAIDLTRTLLELPGAAATRLDLGDLGALDELASTTWLTRSLPAVTADLVGVMQGGLDLAVEYACDRKQFGQPIGSFQAVQHLCAEQKVSLEGARSATWYAAWAADHRPTDQAMLASRTAKAFGATAGRAVTEAVIQVHGGIGITWECAAHLYLKRALLTREVLGDEHEQLRQIAAVRYEGAAR